jgi:hypothetical protein
LQTIFAYNTLEAVEEIVRYMRAIVDDNSNHQFMVSSNQDYSVLTFVFKTSGPLLHVFGLSVIALFGSMVSPIPEGILFSSMISPIAVGVKRKNVLDSRRRKEMDVIIMVSVPGHKKL